MTFSANFFHGWCSAQLAAIGGSLVVIPTVGAINAVVV